MTEIPSLHTAAHILIDNVLQLINKSITNLNGQTKKKLFNT